VHSVAENKDLPPTRAFERKEPVFQGSLGARETFRYGEAKEA
jgi:hypothetical protein